MDINATLLGQMFTFAILVWVTMKYVWPPLMKAMEERQADIASGLQAAEKGVQSLQEAQAQIEQQLNDAKTEAAQLMDQANKRSHQLIEQAKQQGAEERAKLVEAAQADIAQVKQSLRDELRKDIAGLVVHATEQLLEQTVDQKAHAQLLERLVEVE